VSLEERDDTHRTTALHHSSQSGRTGIAEVLFQHGANVNAVDGYGETPIHCAVDNGDLEVVNLLVGAAADLNIRNDNGKLSTEMLTLGPGDNPCPIHQDEIGEESPDFLSETATDQENDSVVKRRDFAKKYQVWRREGFIKTQRSLSSGRAMSPVVQARRVSCTYDVPLQLPAKSSRLTSYLFGLPFDPYYWITGIDSDGGSYMAESRFSP